MTCIHLRRGIMAAAVVAAAVSAGGIAGGGCGPSYEQQRPPMDQLDSRDQGLQSKDVLAASDSLAMDLLSLPELNASRTQWTVVFDRVEDNTKSQVFHGDYNIFLQRLQTNVARHGKGRVRVIENRERFHGVRERELEGGGGSAGDEFGQGEGGGGGASAARQPDFALYGKAMDLPGSGTVYYNLQFDLVDLHTREIIWTGQYEVRTSR
jgi:hypothetical protein